MNSVEQLNSLAIAEGLLLPDGMSERIDFSPQLGRDLSKMEWKCYSVIHFLSLDGPVSKEKIYKGVYGVDPSVRSDLYGIWCLISRIRAKLGYEAIITQNDLGYISRRALNQCSH
jgi:hypothetical protein